jgi:hypothetical protein
MEGQIEAMFRNDAEATPPEPTPEPIVETPPVEAPVEPIAEPVEQPSPEPVVEAEAPKEERAIPLATFLDQRDELKATKRRLAELEANRQQSAAPSPFDDPDAYNGYVQEQITSALTNQRMAMSDVMARQAHGAETVEKAAEWASSRAETDPVFRASWVQTLQSSPHPIDWIVQQHKRDALLSDIGDSPDAWFEREAAKRGYAALSAPVVAAQAAPMNPAPRPQAPPKSIAGDASPANAPIAPGTFDWSFLDRK